MHIQEGRQTFCGVIGGAWVSNSIFKREVPSAFILGLFSSFSFIFQYIPDLNSSQVVFKTFIEYKKKRKNYNIQKTKFTKCCALTKGAPLKRQYDPKNSYKQAFVTFDTLPVEPQNPFLDICFSVFWCVSRIHIFFQQRNILKWYRFIVKHLGWIRN